MDPTVTLGTRCGGEVEARYNMLTKTSRVGQLHFGDTTRVEHHIVFNAGGSADYASAAGYDGPCKMPHSNRRIGALDGFLS